MRRGLGIDVLACDCGGRRRLIALIRPGPVATRILAHLELPIAAPTFAPARAPPDLDLRPEAVDDACANGSIGDDSGWPD